MKLFSFLKKRQEKIDLSIPDIPSKSLSDARDEEIYYERVEYRNNKYNIKDLETKEDQNILLSEINLSFQKTANFLFHLYSFLRLFSRAADKDNNFNEKVLYNEKQINRIKKIYDDFKRKIDILKHNDFNEPELEALEILINDLFNHFSDLEKELNEHKNKYYKHLKMTSYSICNDKTYQELDTLYKSVNKIIDEYKNINDSYDYIYYNSGALIVDTINALMECINNSNNKELKKTYLYGYFLNSDYVVALSFTEWVELFTKLKYVMQIASKVEVFNYLKFKDLYMELEKRYILMLIYTEIKK